MSAGSRLAEAPELLIVLGGGLAPDGRPSASTLARTHRAALVVKRSPDVVVIVSAEGPEAAAIAADLTGQGVDAERIVVEDEARDTIGSAVLVAARYLLGLEPRSIHLVTSPFHLQRATEVFRHVLGFAWQVQAVSADETDDDVARASAETGLLQDLDAFFQGTEPGDLPAIAAKLRQSSPYYAGLATLQPTTLKGR